jgi:hypothetical protein
MGHDVACVAYANVQEDEQQPAASLAGVHAAWYSTCDMGVQVGLLQLQPVIGRKLRKAGADRGTVDGHGV